MIETVAQLTQGLELLIDLPGGAERDELERRPRQQLRSLEFSPIP
jgi:hypothetical protein